MSSGRNFLNFGTSSETARTGGHHQVTLDWAETAATLRGESPLQPEALFIGRSDQYRLGDLLIPQILSRMLSVSKWACAGLVEADWSAVGGPLAGNYGDGALEMRGSQLKLIHFGGDILACDLIEAYGTALQGVEREHFLSLAEISGRDELRRYARRRTGQISDLAYVLEAEGAFAGAEAGFHAVGLSHPERLDEGARAGLLSALRRAAFVGVRDETGASFLESEGIAVERMPCALSVLSEVGAASIREARRRESLENLRKRFPNGWIAVETSGVSPEHGDRLGAALRELGQRENLGLVFFEANASAEGSAQRLRPWVESFPEWRAAEFTTEDLWEKAALLLHARLYCGGDLSSRAICMSGGVARINLPVGNAEALSYCELWEHDQVPIEFSEEEDWRVALTEAMEVGLPLLQEHGAWLRARYRESFERFCGAMALDPRESELPATPHQRMALERRRHRAEWERLSASHSSPRPLPGRPLSGTTGRFGRGLDRRQGGGAKV